MTDTPSEQESEGAARLCTCYCLQAWGAPIAAPYVPVLPTTISLTGFFPPTQTEVETGDEFWTATVVQKTYNCTTKAVTATATLNLNLVHNTYQRSRTRTFVFAWPPWGPWGAWTPIANTGNLANGAALATSTPPSTPHCPDDGVPCP